MKVLCLILVLACVSFTHCKHWAVILAGAKGYENYRHQANACHAYQIMVKNGIPRENIITMMMDDIANNFRNPFKGNIINEIGGPNVYAGIKIDYRGYDVSAKNFLKVLKGEATNVGTGRVVNSGPDDHIFIYYSDHGGKGFLMFPDGHVLYASKINEAIMSMHHANRYHKMVFYIEACHSGSMFDKRLPSNVNVFAMTAANPYESSYGCCYDRQRHAFVGDQFSGNWMRDTEHQNIFRETVDEQFEHTKRATRHSHVSGYGDRNGIGGMKVGDFQGPMNHAASLQSGKETPVTDVTPTWEIPHQMLLRELQVANTSVSRLEVLDRIKDQQTAQIAIKNTLESIVGEVSPNPGAMLQMREIEPSKELDSCYEKVVDAYLETCTKYKDYDYFLKDTYVFENLCSEGVSAERMVDAITSTCQE